MEKNEPTVKLAYFLLTHTHIHQRHPNGLLVHLQLHWVHSEENNFSEYLTSNQFELIN